MNAKKETSYLFADILNCDFSKLVDGADSPKMRRLLIILTAEIPLMILDYLMTKMMILPYSLQMTRMTMTTAMKTLISLLLEEILLPMTSLMRFQKGLIKSRTPK